MQVLELYFQRCGTPAAGSPVGLAMIELIKWIEPSILKTHGRR